MAQGSLNTDALQMEALLLARTYLYTLFHKALGGEPTAELLEVLVNNTTNNVVDEYAQDSETLAGLKTFLSEIAADTEGFLDKAKDEYTRIFIGPMTLPASPYESPYRTMEATLFQENTLVVREAFRAGGYLPKAYQHVPDDHVALVCHFAALKAKDALDAFRAGELEESATMLRMQNMFVREHMANWLGEYARQLRYSKTAVLYPQLIEALAAFVETDVVFADEAAFWLESSEAEGSASAALVPTNGALAALQEIRLPHLSDNELATI